VSRSAAVPKKELVALALQRFQHVFYLKSLWGGRWQLSK
jgi:hypothetical protein